MSRQDAIRRAAAALRLAERATTAGEQAAASAAAQAIMDKYEIEREALLLEGAAPPEPDEEIVDFGTRRGGSLVHQTVRLEPWRSRLALVVAQANGCYVYLRGKTESIEVVGMPGNVETVRYLYGWLARELHRLADEEGAGMGRVWRREFKEGAITEIRNRMREQHEDTVHELKRTAAERSGVALVRIDTAVQRVEQRSVAAMMMAHKTRKLQPKGGSRAQYDESAREAGAHAARKLDLGARRKEIGGGL